MANKKQSKKNKINIKKALFITYNTVIVISLILCGIAIYSQDRIIESLATQHFNGMTSDITDSLYEPLSIDATEKKAYVPQAELRFDYNYLASTTRYQLLSTDTTDSSGVKAIINFTENYQLIDRSYSSDKACVNPFLIVIGDDVPSEYAESGTKTLDDGRLAIFATSTEAPCNGYTTGLSGADFLSFLKTVNSY